MLTGNNEQGMSGKEISEWMKNNKPEFMKEMEEVAKSKQVK